MSPGGLGAPPGRRRGPALRQLNRPLRPRWSPSPLIVGAAVAAAAPFLGFALRMLLDRPDVTFGGDQALIELATGEAAHLDRLEGPYSRYHWSHPGPSWFYLMAAPYRLLGSHSWSLLVALALVHAVAAVAIVWVAARAGGAPLALVAAGLVLAYVRSAGIDVFVYPWNPWALFLPLALLVLLISSPTGSPAFRLFAAAGVGSLLVQTHIGVAPLVVVLVAWAVAAEFIAVPGNPRARLGAIAGSVSRRRLGAGLVALGLVWLPTLVEQFTRTPGNLTNIAGWVGDEGSEGAGPGIGDSARVASTDLSRFPRTGPRAPDDGSLPDAVPAGLAFYAGVAGVLLAGGRRFGDAFAARVGARTLVAIPVSVASISVIVPPVLFHLHAWASVLVVPVWIAAASLGLGLLGDRGRRGVAAGLVVTVAALAWVTARPVVDGSVGVPSHPVVIGAWRLVEPAVAADPAASRHRILIRIAEDGQWPIAAGLALQLRQAGYDSAVTRRWVYLFGSNFRPGGAPGQAGPELVLNFREAPLSEDQAAGARLLGSVEDTDVWFRRSHELNKPAFGIPRFPRDPNAGTDGSGGAPAGPTGGRAAPTWAAPIRWIDSRNTNATSRNPSATGDQARRHSFLSLREGLESLWSD